MDEECELLQLLVDITGGPVSSPDAATNATRLSVDDPMPPIAFTGQVLCGTGRFMFGPRAQVVHEIETRSGKFSARVLLRTYYVVFGELDSTDWAHSTRGRKIKQALELRKV